MTDRPNRDAMNQAIGIYRDTMRLFITRNLRKVHCAASKIISVMCCICFGGQPFPDPLNFWAVYQRQS